MALTKGHIPDNGSPNPAPLMKQWTNLLPYNEFLQLALLTQPFNEG